ncbi:MAG TPA: hypothetical protein PKE55_03510 [Kiritimatiellia bacterium]|nr:hypothetical protein [Kiritimatiellia bacterium]
MFVSMNNRGGFAFVLRFFYTLAAAGAGTVTGIEAVGGAGAGGFGASLSAPGGVFIVFARL